MSSQIAQRRKSNRLAGANKRPKARRPLLEILEARQMLTGSPRITGLEITNVYGPSENSPIYDGDSIKLTATGVSDPDGTIDQVKFYLDDGDGVLDSNDLVLDTPSSDTNGNWSTSVLDTHGSPQIPVGRHIFFAQATNTNDDESNVVALPWDVLSVEPVVEAIDNTWIVAGRRYVLSVQADLPPGTDSAFSYDLQYVNDTNEDQPSNYTFNDATGTMIWDTTSGDASDDPYHFQIKAIDGLTSAESEWSDFYLTVLDEPQSLDSAPSEIEIVPLGFFHDVNFYVYCGCPPAGTTPTTADVSTGAPGSDPTYAPVTTAPPVMSTLPSSPSPSSSGWGLIDSPFVTTLEYNPATNPHVIIELSVQASDIELDGAAYLSVEPSILSLAGDTTIATGDTVFYTTAGAVSPLNRKYAHLALPVEVPDTTPDGLYPVKLILRYYDSAGDPLLENGSPMVREVSQTSQPTAVPGASVRIVNRIDSAVGNRWSISDIDELVISPDGDALLVSPNGSTHWFEYDPVNEDFTAQGNDNRTLVVENGEYLLKSPDSSYQAFDTLGRLIAKADYLGNTVVYQYYGSDAHEAGEKPNALFTIIDPSNRPQTLTYDTNGRLETIEDYANRQTTLSYDTSGHLTQIVKPDLSTQLFTYNLDGLLTSKTNELGETTYFFYDEFTRLTRTVFPDGASEIIQSPDTANMWRRVIVDYYNDAPVYLGSDIFHPDSSQVIAAPLLPWDFDYMRESTKFFQGPVGRIVDRGGNVTHYGVSPTGELSFVTEPVTGTSSEHSPWQHGASTFYEYGAHHLLSRVVEPGPGTSVNWATTSFVWDASFNLVEMYSPDRDAAFFDNPRYSYDYTNPSNPSAPNPLNLLYGFTEAEIIANETRTTSYTYYTSGPTTGLLYKITDELSGETVFTHTDGSEQGIPIGLVASVMDPNGITTSYDYYSYSDATSLPGAWGMVKEITVSDGTASATTSFEYDAPGNLIKMVDAGGRVTRYSYDELGRLEERQLRGDAAPEESGPKWQYVYNLLGLLVESVDPNDNHTRYLYNLNDQVAAVLQPDPDGDGALPGPTTIYQYTANQFVETVVDPLGRWMQFEYDARNQLIAEIQADPVTGLIDENDSPRIEYFYDNAGNLLAMDDAESRLRTKYVYDASHRVIQVLSEGVSGPDVLQAAYVYNGFDQVTSIELPDITEFGGRFTTYEYDDLGRVEFVFPPDSEYGGKNADTYYQYTYDAGGRVMTVTAPSPDEGTTPGAVTTYEYDYLNRTTAVIEGDIDGPTTEYFYDPDFGYYSITDPTQNTTTWNYDQFGRIATEVTSIEETYNTRSYEYDANGNLLEYTDRNGHVTQYTYDRLNRMTQERWYHDTGYILSLERTLDYTYDWVGNLLHTSDPSATYDFSYDKLDRQEAVTIDLPDVQDVVLTSAYDKNGNRIELAATVTVNNVVYADFVNTYEYDFLNRLTVLTQKGQGGTGAHEVAIKQVGLSYTYASEISKINRFDHEATNPSTSTSGSHAWSTLTYNHAGSLVFQSDKLESFSPPKTQTWEYDNLNRVTDYEYDLYHVVDPIIVEDVSYDYDVLNQLTSEEGASTTDYEYDDAGNRIDDLEGYAYDAGNRLIEDPSYRYEYDYEGNMFRRTTKNPGGLERVLTIFYDHRNRVVSLFEAPYLGGQSDFDLYYQYDTLNRRVARSRGTTVDGGEGGEVTVFNKEKYIYDGDHVVLDFEKPDGYPADAYPARRYLYGNAVDQIFAQEDISTVGLEGETLWMLTDNLGSVRDLVNNDGELVEHYQYDAYGNMVGRVNGSGNAVALDDPLLTRYLFTAREFDEDTGLQYNRNRWYDSKSGRWLSEDPIGFEGGDYNLYRYVGNGPTNATDPTGEFVWMAIPIGIGFWWAMPSNAHAPGTAEEAERCNALDAARRDTNARDVEIIIVGATTGRVIQVYLRTRGGPGPTSSSARPCTDPNLRRPRFEELERREMEGLGPIDYIPLPPFP